MLGARVMSIESKRASKKRALRTRNKIRSVSKKGRLRLSVFCSNLNVYAQIIDDAKGRTIVSASTVEKKEVMNAKTAKAKSSQNIESAARIGGLLGVRAKDAGVTHVVFDRGGRMYHGRVKALADAARGAGLVF